VAGAVKCNWEGAIAHEHDPITFPIQEAGHDNLNKQEAETDQKTERSSLTVYLLHQQAVLYFDSVSSSLY
jgi:hypothetical protein